MRHRRVWAGCVARVVVLAGNAGTHQPARTCAQNRAIASADRFANSGTGHCTNAGTYNGVEVIRMGLRGKNHHATRHEREANQFSYFCSRWREKRC